MVGKPQMQVVPGVGERIKVLLHRHPTIGTVTALGAAANLSRQTLHRAVNDDTLTVDTARQIAAVLGVGLTYFLDGEAKGPPTPATTASLTATDPNPLAVREYLAEAQLELVRAGWSDAQVQRALALLQSPVWSALWRELRGASPTRSDVELAIDGMKAGTELLRRALYIAASQRYILDGMTDEANAEKNRILAGSQHLIGPGATPGAAAGANEGAETARKSEKRRRPA